MIKMFDYGMGLNEFLVLIGVLNDLSKLAVFKGFIFQKVNVNGITLILTNTFPLIIQIRP